MRRRLISYLSKSLFTSQTVPVNTSKWQRRYDLLAKNEMKFLRTQNLCPDCTCVSVGRGLGDVPVPPSQPNNRLDSASTVFFLAGFYAVTSFSEHQNRCDILSAAHAHSAINVVTNTATNVCKMFSS